MTFTWSIFGYSIKGSHNLSNLIASSDDEPESEGKLNVTFMFNWWKAETRYLVDAHRAATSRTVFQEAEIDDVRLHAGQLVS